jgi:beta-mannanase
MPLDTNGDGKVDSNDDPFSPYYPGDDWVDWVGLSVYWFGPKWPWEDNESPTAGYFERVLSGGDSSFSLYDLYSGNSGSAKPFMVTETAATVHMMKIGTNQASPIGVNYC